jgi:hypothetical protein
MATANYDLPDTLPFWGDSRVDRAGNIWLRWYVLPCIAADSIDWAVFRPDGRLLGTVAIPDNVFVLDIGDDYILWSTFDEKDVPIVELMPLIKEARSNGR